MDVRTRVSIEIDAKAVGEAFAHTDDEAQAAMINEMALELKASCGGKVDMQVCYFSKHLDNNGKKLIKDIKEFIDLRDGEAE